MKKGLIILSILGVLAVAGHAFAQNTGFGGAYCDGSCYTDGTFNRGHHGGHHGGMMGGSMMNGGVQNGQVQNLQAINADQAKQNVQKFITDNNLKGYTIEDVTTIQTGRGADVFVVKVKDAGKNNMQFNVNPFGYVYGPVPVR